MNICSYKGKNTISIEIGSIDRGKRLLAYMEMVAIHSEVV